MASKSTITLNEVEVRIYSFENEVDKKRYIEVYPEKSDDFNKMFISESLITGKTMSVKVFIDNYPFQLSEKYEYGMALHIFTDLLNKFSKNQNK